MKTRYFRIKDIDCEFEVVETTRKEVLSYLDTYVDNIAYRNKVDEQNKREIEEFGVKLTCNNVDCSDIMVAILYKDGTEDVIDENYDGHKIKRQNIKSIMYEDSCTTLVYGTYTINEYGVVTVSDEMEIDDTNIEELRK